MGRGVAVPLSWVSTWHTRTWDRVSSSAHPGRGHMVSGYIPLKSSLTPLTVCGSSGPGGTTPPPL